MQAHLRTRPAATLLLSGILAIAGCSTTPASTPAAGGPTTAVTPTDAATPPPEATEAAALILEDAGLETPMAAGTYTSRLFEPTITLELDGSWFRRDAGDARRFNIRRGPNGEEDLTFFSGIDFIQCGDGDVVESPPDASTVVDMLFGMPELNTTQPEEVAVGGRTGIEIRLLGGGDGSIDDFEGYLAHGCVLSFGDVPYPEDSSWLVALDSSEEQLFFVDVDGTVVVIRARHGSGDVEALWDYMCEVIATVQLG